MAAQSKPARVRHAVFINCPFDRSYQKIFDGIIFAVCRLGFEPRCALEQDSGAKERLTKILHLIEECPFAIHDLSYMTLDPGTRLPRHNMAFELGLFLGWEFANRRRTRKSCLILDREAYRYRKSLSDLSGRDIQPHKGTPALAMRAVRDWLVTESGYADAPGGDYIVKQYRSFRRRLPQLCKRMRRKVKELPFHDYRDMVEAWLERA